MEILVLTPYYSPDLGPSAPLYTMLSESLVKGGHTVSVLTTVPHYPTGQVDSAFRAKWIWRSTENGVNVIRIGLPSVRRSNLAMRLLQFLWYQLGAALAGINLNYDVVIAANPALWVWLPFAYFIVSKGKPSVFSIHDVYPDVGVTLGVFRHRSVIEAVRVLERYCLQHCSAVRILSGSFRSGLRNLGVPDSKMTLIYDWVDTDLIRPTARDNPFARANRLANRFVILYAGNLGLSQGLESVLSAAEQLSGESDIHFLFVGEGPGRESLMKRANAQKLTNVQFLPFQPRSCLPDVLGSADVSLVVLRRGIGAGSLPSKTFSILASGRPIIASVDEQSETWNLIREAQAGVCIEPESPSELVKAILLLRNDPGLRAELGRNGRTWAEKNHSPQSATIRFEELLQRAIHLTELEHNPSD